NTGSAHIHHISLHKRHGPFIRWAAHRDEEVYGVDADDWRPGRWIDASPEKRKEMERFLFAFGGGSRVCLGRNISYLEMYKVIPEVLTRFKVCHWSLVVNGFEKPRALGLLKLTVPFSLN
ncbi:pisatin demethylase, partial [Penicillium longicatenatum]